jgi:hypothetical protein
MWLPFRNKWEELFQSDRSVWFKIGIGASIGALAATQMLFVNRMGPSESRLRIPAGIAMVVLFAGLGALGVSVLTLKDVIRRKTERGHRAGFLTRLYFWKGGWSYVVWFLTALVLALALTMIGVALTL